jgi:hypothetical protein
MQHACGHPASKYRAYWGDVWGSARCEDACLVSQSWLVPVMHGVHDEIEADCCVSQELQ